METKQTKQTEKKKVDWLITLLPLGLIVVLCILFFFKPEQSNQVLSQIRYVFGDTFGTYYLVIGIYLTNKGGIRIETSIWQPSEEENNE